MLKVFVDAIVVSLVVANVDICGWFVMLVSEIAARGVDCNGATFVEATEVLLKDVVIVLAIDGELIAIVVRTIDVVGTVFVVW